jgi:acetyl-CoA carboxylase biotin carboxyl carrier protein
MRFGGPEVDADVMTALLEAFERSDWQEMTVTIGGDQLHISRQAPVNGTGPTHAVPPPVAAAPATAAPATAASGAAPATPAPATPAPATAASAAAPAASSPLDAPAPPAAAASEPTGVAAAAVVARPVTGTPVTSPSVGLFWRAPSPGAPPFVEIGGPVAQGDTVAIVEVMKLMNHVTAPVSGTVTAVLPENGEAVEYGQVLVTIDPEP